MIYIFRMMSVNRCEFNSRRNMEIIWILKSFEKFGNNYINSVSVTKSYIAVDIWMNFPQVSTQFQQIHDPNYFQ